MNPKPEAAGLEVMSGCLAIVGLGFFGLVSLIVRWWPRRTMYDDRLISMIQDFVLGRNRTLQHVEAIHYFLMTQFVREPAYQDILTATASFVPEGGAHFHDEKTLALEFQTFLKMRYGIKITVYEDTQGVWPPPPQPNRGKIDA